jgi:hypothetical protein
LGNILGDFFTNLSGHPAFLQKNKGFLSRATVGNQPPIFIGATYICKGLFIVDKNDISVQNCGHCLENLSFS